MHLSHTVINKQWYESYQCSLWTFSGLLGNWWNYRSVRNWGNNRITGAELEILIGPILSGCIPDTSTIYINSEILIMWTHAHTYIYTTLGFTLRLITVHHCNTGYCGQFLCYKYNKVTTKKTTFNGLHGKCLLGTLLYITNITLQVPTLRIWVLIWSSCFEVTASSSSLPRSQVPAAFSPLVTSTAFPSCPTVLCQSMGAPSDTTYIMLSV